MAAKAHDPSGSGSGGRELREAPAAKLAAHAVSSAALSGEHRDGPVLSHRPLMASQTPVAAAHAAGRSPGGIRQLHAARQHARLELAEASVDAAVGLLVGLEAASRSSAPAARGPDAGPSRDATEAWGARVEMTTAAARWRRELTARARELLITQRQYEAGAAPREHGYEAEETTWRVSPLSSGTGRSDARLRRGRRASSRGSGPRAVTAQQGSPAADAEEAGPAAVASLQKRGANVAEESAAVVDPLADLLVAGNRGGRGDAARHPQQQQQPPGPSSGATANLTGGRLFRLPGGRSILQPARRSAWSGEGGPRPTLAFDDAASDGSDDASAAPPPPAWFGRSRASDALPPRLANERPCNPLSSASQTEAGGTRRSFTRWDAGPRSPAAPPMLRHGERSYSPSLAILQSMQTAGAAIELPGSVAWGGGGRSLARPSDPAAATALATAVAALEMPTQAVRRLRRADQGLPEFPGQALADHVVEPQPTAGVAHEHPLALDSDANSDGSVSSASSRGPWRIALRRPRRSGAEQGAATTSATAAKGTGCAGTAGGPAAAAAAHQQAAEEFAEDAAADGLADMRAHVADAEAARAQ